MARKLIEILFTLFLALLLDHSSVLSIQVTDDNFFNTNTYSGQLLQFSTMKQDEVMRVDYRDSQLWKIHTRNLKNKVIKTLLKIGGEIWNVNLDGIDMFLRSHLTKVAKELIDKSDLTYNIMIEDIQEVIDQNNQVFAPVEEDVNITTLQRAELIYWDKYHNVNDIDEFMYAMLDYYPKLTHLMTAGRSVEKRHIKVLRVSNGIEGNPAIFICGGIQGRDWIGPAAITFMIYKLARSWRDHPEYVRNIDWYFLPVLNPDGYEYSHTVDRFWNKNRRDNGECQGVNIDRNFGFRWSKKGSSGEPCSRLFRGPDRNSEPETKALRKAIRSLGPRLLAYISVGGYGQVVTYPWGDDDFVPDNAEEMHRVAKLAIKSMRRTTGSEYRVGSSFRLQLPSAGNSADWVFSSANPEYVYNLVLKDLGRYGYLLPPSFIQESGEEAFAMIQTVAESLS